MAFDSYSDNYHRTSRSTLQLIEVMHLGDCEKSALLWRLKDYLYRVELASHGNVEKSITLTNTEYYDAIAYFEEFCADFIRE